MAFAEPLYRYAIRNPRQTARVLRGGYNLARRAYSTYTRSRPTTRARPAARRPYVSRKQVTLQNKRRNYRRKVRKLNKVAPAQPKRSIYTKRNKRMTRYNRSPLALQYRLQAGQDLPETTFVRLHWRGSQNVDFSVNTRASTGNINAIKGRTLCLNDISSSPYLAAPSSHFPSLIHGINYKPMWESLYEQWLVLGAKLTLKISPKFYPSAFANNGLNTDPGTVVPANAQPGYFYIRVNYERTNTSGTTSMVGHPIEFVNTVDDNQDERIWPDLRSFLTDTTVTYKKDHTRVSTKLHMTNESGSKFDNTNNAVDLFPTASHTYEIETNNKPTYLTANFSAKKHFEEKNPLTNLPFLDWSSSLAAPYQFKVRYGYIGFDATGRFSYHIPIDREQSKFVETDINYFVALRGPRFRANDSEIPATVGARALPLPIPETNGIAVDDQETNDIGIGELESMLDDLDFEDNPSETESHYDY